MLPPSLSLQALLSRISLKARTSVLGATLIFGFLSLTASAKSITQLDFWHSYVHSPDRVLHYSFRIAKYKRGLFFGSCGPSTKSLQWEYEVDVAGPGPTYEKEHIKITTEGKPIELFSGKIAIDSQQERATIELRVNVSGSPTNFIGNGTYSVKQLK